MVLENSGGRLSSDAGLILVRDFDERIGLTRQLALAQYAERGEKQRLFRALAYQADSWDHARNVVIKAECHAAGTNRRAVVTNRSGAMFVPQGVYDDYVQRGESENRNKELKVDLYGGRLSDHRFMANLFRLYMHAAALNLLIRLRSELPEADPQAPPRPTGHLAAAADQSRGGGECPLPTGLGPPEFGLAESSHLADGAANGPAVLKPPPAVTAKNPSANHTTPWGRGRCVPRLARIPSTPKPIPTVYANGAS